MDAEKLFNDNQKLLTYFIKKYSNYGHFLEFDDYRQIVTLAFWKGCKHFDTKKGKLSAVITKCIFNDLNRLIITFKCKKVIKSYVELTEANSPIYTMPIKDECINILKSNFKGTNLNIMIRYFVNGDYMHKIGFDYGITKERIRQIVYKNIKYLKSKKLLAFYDI